MCFRAHVTDAANCAVRNANVDLALEGTATGGATFRDACFNAGNNAAQSEGEFRIVGTSGALRDVARVRVRLSDLSDLIARRGEEGLFGTDTHTAAPATPQDTVDVAARSATTETGSTATVVAVVSGLVLGLLLLAFFVLLRRKKSQVAVPAEEDAWSAPAAPAAPTPPANTENMICPVCRRGYAPNDATCSHDGATLLPYSKFVADSKAAEELHSKSKLCPKCGERYPMTSTFCGKDGTTLIVPR